MLRSLYSGSSSMRNHQVKLDVLGNNIANLNTIGFKASRVNFADTLSQTISQTSQSNGVYKNQKQIGTGVSHASVNKRFSEGVISATGNPTDIAISGDSFFILNQEGDRVFSRAGSFYLNSAGVLTNSEGLKVQGWMGDGNTTPSTIASLSDIQLSSDIQSDPLATNKIQLSGNLNKSLEPEVNGWIILNSLSKNNGLNSAQLGDDLNSLDQFSELNDGNGLLADGTESINFGGVDKAALAVDKTFTYGSTNDGTTVQDLLNFLNGKDSGVPVFDGTVARLTSNGHVTIEVDGELDDSTIDVTSLTGSGFGDLFSEPPIKITGEDAETVRTSSIVFDSMGESHNVIIDFQQSRENGKWYWQAMTNGEDSIIAGNSGTVNFDEDGKMALGSLTFDDGSESMQISYNNGASVENLQIELGGSDDLAVTTFASGSSLFVNNQDGRASGEFSEFTIESDGSIVAKFNNGGEEILAHLALANFMNPTGLENLGGSNFADTAAAGDALIGYANSLDSEIVSGALELSNVDLADEFTEMIIAQRGFQAATRIVSTADQILEEVVRLK